jgi:hypothetical protein
MSKSKKVLFCQTNPNGNVIAKRREKWFITR